MKIAILGWGSLIWDPQGLAYEGNWRTGGPNLPVEFSRISSDGRLTLVIDRNNGQIVSTQYTTSTLTTLADAVENLHHREKTSVENIGFIDLQNQNSHSRHNDLVVQLKSWAQENDFDAVIWTDLPSKFEIGGKAVPFSVNTAVDYLQGLSGETADKAREYIAKAPEEVDTPVRRKIQMIGWLKEGT